MKDLKDILLERRIKELKIEGKKIPQMYIDVFNDYIEEIAESLADHDKQVRKEVVQEIRKKLICYPVSLLAGKVKANVWGISRKDLIKILDQIQGEDK